MSETADRLTWKAGDLDVQVSQCSKCKFNDGMTECLVYGEKPVQFKSNSEECPERIEEKA